MHISAINLLTHDLGNTFDFYHNKLGLPVKDRRDQHITFMAGKTDLTFTYSDSHQHPVYHFAFTIPSNKLKEAFDFIQAKTIIMDVPSGSKIADFSNWNADAFYFYDNNGNILEFIARYALQNQSDEAFSGTSIYAISEIGLVTDNVPALAQKITKDYGVSIFEHQPAMEQFTVLGDDYGLFILVARGRTWFPTQIKAKLFPLTIYIQNNLGEDIRIDYPFE
ncbi:MAG: VOC family protein [Taibaiella sp.]|jgi:catechol-2,3-dioxygenase